MGGGSSNDTDSPKTWLQHASEEGELEEKLQNEINPHLRTLIGQPPDRHWMHYQSPPIIDLTRPAPPEFPLPKRDESIWLLANKQMVAISPAKTALVIIDMQNFFLSPALGRDADGAGNMARKQLLETAIPAANAAGIQVVWLNEDINQMPASVLQAFGARKVRSAADERVKAKTMDKPERLYRGLGNELGKVTLEDGTVIQGGKMLMRDYWNTDLPPDLKSSFEAGKENEPAHVWMHKNRMSGLWHSELPFAQFLKDRGICTLLFAGVNTDQCVGGTLQDAYSQGFDCILLSDACGTSSPDFAKQCIEYNTERSWGFVSNCAHFKHAVEGLLNHRRDKDSGEKYFKTYY